MLSVIVCTWNRAALLQQTLEHLAAARPPSVAWELIVVDNNSTDRTPAVINQWQLRLPVRGVLEPRPGIAYARNAGLDATQGEYTLWADDDTRVPVDWFQHYEAGFKAWPDAGLFGGPILPRFEVEPPQWLQEIWSTVAIVYGECKYGDRELLLQAPDRLPYGANFALRRSAAQGRRFDVQLGRREHAGALSEETAFFAHLLASGVTGRWLPKPAVQHWVGREKLTVAYIRHQYELYGKTCLLRDPANHEVRHVGSVPRWALRRAVEGEIRYRWARLWGGPQSWIEPLIEASSAWGVVKSSSGRL